LAFHETLKQNNLTVIAKMSDSDSSTSYRAVWKGALSLVDVQRGGVHFQKFVFCFI
jgi:hypothetical protein